MSKDVSVKEADLLFGFASDLRNSGQRIDGNCTLLINACFATNSEVYVHVHRIQDALKCAREDLDAAIRAYDDYLYYTDAESVSEDRLYYLRADIDRAREHCHRVSEDLDYAGQIANTIQTYLSNLRSSAETFKSQIVGSSEKAASSVSTAAHHILQYKSIK